MLAGVPSHARLSATPWTVVHPVPLSMEFSRQEYRSGLPFPPPGDLPDPGVEPESPTLAVEFFATVPPGKLRVLISSPQVSVFASRWHSWILPVRPREGLY